MTSLRTTVAVLALAASGCLTIPPPAESDGGPGPGPDAGPPCGASTDYSNQPFPPPGTEIAIRDLVITDINLDGVQDVVLTNADVIDVTDRGFFVLLGPQNNVSEAEYHAFVRTGVAPYSLVVGDLSGDTCLDIAIFGNSGVGQNGFLQVFENTGPEPMFSASPQVSKETDFAPDGAAAPVLLTLANLDGQGGVNDFAFSDLTRLRTIYLSGAVPISAELPDAQVATVDPDGGSSTTPWDTVNAIIRRKGFKNPTVDDLLIVENRQVKQLINDGSGAFPGPQPEAGQGDFVFHTVAEADLDDEPPLDLVGGAFSEMGSYSLTTDGATLNLNPADWVGMESLQTTELSQILAGELDGMAENPEIVVLEPTGGVILLPNAFVDGLGVLQPSTQASLEISPTGPYAGGILDFDDSGTDKIWAFARGGQMYCVESIGSPPTLRFCE